MTTEGRTSGQTPHCQPLGQRANRPPKGKAGGERGLNKKGLRGPNPTGGSSGSRSAAPAWLAEIGPLTGWAWSHGEDFPNEAPQTLGPPSHTRPCEVPGAGGDHKMPCKPPPRHRPTSPPHINPNSPQTIAPTPFGPPPPHHEHHQAQPLPHVASSQPPGRHPKHHQPYMYIYTTNPQNTRYIKFDTGTPPYKQFKEPTTVGGEDILAPHTWLSTTLQPLPSTARTRGPHRTQLRHSQEERGYGVGGLAEVDQGPPPLQPLWTETTREVPDGTNKRTNG